MPNKFQVTDLVYFILFLFATVYLVTEIWNAYSYDWFHTAGLTKIAKVDRSVISMWEGFGGVAFVWLLGCMCLSPLLACNFYMSNNINTRANGLEDFVNNNEKPPIER